MIALRQLLFSAVLVIILGYNPASIVAQSASSFTYQGNLTNNGTVQNGNFDFEFRVFDAVTAGTQRGVVVTSSSVVVTNGVFNVVLDFGDSVFTGDNRWLQIDVRPHGSGGYTTLTPRQKMNPTPYAYRALAAGGVNVVGDDFVFGAPSPYNAGNVAANNSRFLFIKSKGAFRAGNDSIPFTGHANWQLDSIGLHSSAFGRGVKALGEASFAGGSGVTARGANSFAFGNNGVYANGQNSVVFGSNGIIGSGNYSFTLAGHGTVGATGEFSFIHGSSTATASGIHSVARGKNTVTASGAYSYAHGDAVNTASGAYSRAYGTGSNTASDTLATAIGRSSNTASGIYSLAIGRSMNTASGEFAVAIGRSDNFATGSNSFAIGHSFNQASGVSSVAFGNSQNQATGENSFAFGENFNSASGANTYAFGRGQNTASGNTAFAFGGEYNEASGTKSFALGFNENVASAEQSFVIGGSFNRASGTRSMAIGFNQNIANSLNAFAIGSNFNEARAERAIAIGTNQNLAFGIRSIAIGGEGNIASGQGSVSIGSTSGGNFTFNSVAGYGQVASGNNSTAIGFGNLARSYGEVSVGMFSTDYTPASATAMVGTDRAFVIGNGTTHTLRHDAVAIFKNGNINVSTSTLTLLPYGQLNGGNATELRFAENTANGTNYVAFKSAASVANNVVWTLPATDGATGDILSTNGAGVLSWSAAPSDRNKKTEILPVDAEALLQKFEKVPVSTWAYKNDAEKGKDIRHYGPMAQDFHAVFGKDAKGTIGNDTTIASVDINGVNFAAIQALEKRTRELRQVIENQERVIAQLEKTYSEEVESLRSLLKAQQTMLQTMQEENAAVRKVMMQLIEESRQQNAVKTTIKQ